MKVLGEDAGLLMLQKIVELGRFVSAALVNRLTIQLSAP